MHHENLFYYYVTGCLVLVLGYAWHRWRVRRTYQKTFVYDRTGQQGQGLGARQSAPSRKLKREATKLLSTNQMQAAARLYEANGYAHEAAALLSGYGLFDDALKTYLRSQNLHGAGSLLARLGKYAEAIPYFERSKSFSDAAMCAVQLQHWEHAANYFIQAQRFTEAIYCYGKQGLFKTALDLAQKIKDSKQYKEVFDAFAKGNPEDFATLSFSEEEMRDMAKLVNDGDTTEGFILALDTRLGMQELILEEIRNRRDERAASLCKMLEGRQIYKRLVENASYVDQTGEMTGDFLLHLKKYEVSAEAYIRSQAFVKASIVFEKIGDFKRAVDTALSAQDWERADRLRKNLQDSGQSATPHKGAAQKSPKEALGGGIFALDDSGNEPAADVKEVKKPSQQAEERPLVAVLREFGDSKEAPVPMMHDDIKFEINLNDSQSDQVFQININSKKSGSKP